MHTQPTPARLSANPEIVAHSLGEVRLFLEDLKHGTKKYKTIASISGQIAEAYRGRCVLELLQNAHDALMDSQGGEPGRVTFLLVTEPVPLLLVANSGHAFERKDFKGLCQLGQSPKDPNKSVGNKGLGFRSVLEVSSSPEIWSTEATEGDPAFVFRFDPGVCEKVAAALTDLNANGLDARSPFETSELLVDWTEEQLQRYRKRLADEGLDGREEAMSFLSPYDIPLPISERRDAVDELLRDGHVTVVCLPLDGGRVGEINDAVAAVRSQLEDLLDISTPLFLPKLGQLFVGIDGEMTVVQRTVEMDGAFGGYGRSRSQKVEISRTSPSGGENETDRFRVWTRALGGKQDTEWAERIRNAVRHLPNKWPEVDSVEVGVAVREGEEAADGRFVIFLPTEMTTGTGAHINAPFFGSLNRRRIQFDDEYNRMLLDCVVDLSLDAVQDLAAAEPEDERGRTIIDILASHGDVGTTGKSMFKMLCERASGGSTPLDEQQLLLCDGGWTAPASARLMPQVADGLAIGADDWRQSAVFAVVSSALDGRESEVKRLLEGLGGSVAPTETEWMRTVERVALRVQSCEIGANWDGFLTSLLEVLPSNLEREPKAEAEDAFVSAKFLPDQDGRLVSADGQARVFFQPVVGIDDAAELVDTVPDSLKERIAFIHSDVRTHAEGARRRSTEVHKFLEGRFARGFRREEIVRDVILAAVPSMPVPFERIDASLCAELLGWTLGLIGEEPSEVLLAILKDLPVACHGGWRPAWEASFGPGWPGEAGKDLWALCEELPEGAAERLRKTILLNPEDLRWALKVEGRSSLFARIGVAEGLRLKPMGNTRFWMAQAEYKLPEKTPAGVDDADWERWRTAIRPEAEPYHIGRFKYSLENVYQLPELHHVGRLSHRGRRAFSRLVFESMRDWPEGWENATIRKVEGETSTWSVTSPLKYWLSTTSWLTDGGGGERPLRDRWLVPTSLLRGQHDRFHHLRPLSLELTRRLENDPELYATLKRLKLNVYPTDGERIGPELLDGLAGAWLDNRVPSGRFDIFLGQLRHAWHHLDADKGLPSRFLVQTGRRRFNVVDSDSLSSVYLPNETVKGRSLREEGKPILEMGVQDARGFSQILVDTTAVRLASELAERDFIDGVEWTGITDAVRAMEETRYRWLPEPLLAISAHGGPNPTGDTTKGWKDALDRLRGARVVECQSIEVELVDGEETIARSEPPARWLEGDVLAVTAEVGDSYEKLASAAQAMLDRQDLLKDLRLVLGALDGTDAPSLGEIEDALDRTEIDAQAFADIRSRWAGNAGWVASRVRPVMELLGIGGDEFEAVAVDLDRLTDWLADNLPEWKATELIAAARRSRDDHAMGMAAWHVLGNVAQLPAWNAVLEQLSDEYEAVENKYVNEQTSLHLEEAQALLAALAREIAIEHGNPLLFQTIEGVTRTFTAPGDWSIQWWEVPFEAVVDALSERYKDVIDAEHLEALSGTTSSGDLRVALEERGIGIEPDPYETARVNGDNLKKVLQEVHDLYQIWVQVHKPEAEVLTLPAAPKPGPESYLVQWSDSDLWRFALAALGDEQFSAACGGHSDPQMLKNQLGLDEEALKEKRRERAEREREAARQRRIVEIGGDSFEIGSIDYAELLRQHDKTLEQPVGPRASEDEFTPLGSVSDQGGSNGGRRKKGKSGHRRLSPEEADVVGIVGEMHAYRFLREEFGRRAVRASAWVSESRLKVLPLVDGERDETSDGHGFDFRFNHNGLRWHVEVKATKGDESSFELGISEIEAATSIARRRGGTWRWRILRVRNAFSNKPEIDWLPNPFEEGFKKHYRLHQGGMVVSYARGNS